MRWLRADMLGATKEAPRAARRGRSLPPLAAAAGRSQAPHPYPCSEGREPARISARRPLPPPGAGCYGFESVTPTVTPAVTGFPLKNQALARSVTFVTPNAPPSRMRARARRRTHARCVCNNRNNRYMRYNYLTGKGKTCYGRCYASCYALPLPRPGWLAGGAVSLSACGASLWKRWKRGE